jgi:cytochrome P450
VSILDSKEPFRKAGWLTTRMIAAAPTMMGLAQRYWPIPKLGGKAAVTRYDDVLEVFATDTAFGAPYEENLAVITDGQPFFLGMEDTDQYRAQLQAMRDVVLAQDLPRLGEEAERRAEAIVAASNGRVEVVSLVRKVTFDLIGGYFGVPEPPRGSLAVWGSRLFEYQFTGSPKETDWTKEMAELALAFRNHVDAVIAARKAAGQGPDDVLQRCLAAQAAGKPGYSDVEIRTALVCMVVGGPPQPPMVVPQAMEQLLRRPRWLRTAGEAARAGEDARLHDIVFEAMRFDPLAPALPRTALADHWVARGTDRATLIPKGTNVMTAFASAMMDPRRIPDSERFDPDRLPHEYCHFGHGLHQCFGRMINHATLHRMLKPLLARPHIRRARGGDGRLRKNGAFSERLVVQFDAVAAA